MKPDRLVLLINLLLTISVIATACLLGAESPKGQAPQSVSIKTRVGPAEKQKQAEHWSRSGTPAARAPGDTPPLPPSGKTPDASTTAANATAATGEAAPTPPPSRVAVVPGEAPTAGHRAAIPTGRTATALATQLEAPRVVGALREAGSAARDRVLADIETRVVASTGALARLGSTTGEMNAEGRKQFEKNVAEAQQHAAVLRQSLAEARQSGETGWDRNRARLAREYSAYADAIAGVDAVAGLRGNAR